jgi:hypothetical protein
MSHGSKLRTEWEFVVAVVGAIILASAGGATIFSLVHRPVASALPPPRRSRKREWFLSKNEEQNATFCVVPRNQNPRPAFVRIKGRSTGGSVRRQDAFASHADNPYVIVGAEFLPKRSFSDVGLGVHKTRDRVSELRRYAHDHLCIFAGAVGHGR